MSEDRHVVVAATHAVAEPPEGAPKVGADDYPLLKKTCSRYLDADEMAKVDEAYRFAAEFHKDQRRRSGEPYINHPVEVASSSPMTCAWTRTSSAPRCSTTPWRTRLRPSAT